MLLVVLIGVIAFIYWLRTRRTEEDFVVQPDCPPGTSWSVELNECKIPTNKCPPGTYSGTGNPPCLKCRDGKCPNHIIS